MSEILFGYSILFLIETSCDICSVSLLEDNNLILELKDNSVKNHSESLMPLINRLFKETNSCLNDIDLFAVDNGPGSFTGIRIGLASIKAFCDVTNKPCIAVSSLEALAYTVDCKNGYICSLIDAKHENVYAAIFEKNGQNMIKSSDFMFKKFDDLLLNLNSLKKFIFFAGNCGILYKDVIKSYLKNDIFFEEDTLVSSKYVGIAAFEKFKKGEVFSSKELNALYLKKSSAEEKLGN